MMNGFVCCLAVVSPTSLVGTLAGTVSHKSVPVPRPPHLKAPEDLFFVKKS